MNVKLTLTIDTSVVQRAKKYARASGRSLSDLIENYLIHATSGELSTFPTSNKIKALKGSFRIPEDLNYKEGISAILTEKYMK
jgi:hypothetical protein